MIPQELLYDFTISRLILNIPLLLFDFFLIVIFLLALKAFAKIIFAKDELKLEAGKRNLYASFFWLFLLLVSAFIFSSVTFLIKGGSVPAGEGGEFPAFFLASDFPPSPQYLKIGDYYFSEPKPEIEIKKRGLAAVSCKEEQGYGIIALIEASQGENLALNSQYSCWSEKCSSPYFSVLYLAEEEKIAEVLEELSRQTILSCQKEQ